MTRRAALGLAAASALPLAAGQRQCLAAAVEPIPNTWMFAGNAARTGVFPGPGLDLQGEVIELWRIDRTLTNGMFSDPCGVCDGIVYYLPVPDGITDMIRPLIAVDAQSGTELWRHDPPEPAISFSGEAAISDGLVVMSTHSGLLVGMDARTGEQRWVFDMQGTSFHSRPAIVDSVLYVSDTAAVNAITLGDTPEWLWKSSLGDGTTTVVSDTVSVDGDYVVVSSVRPVEGSELDEKTTDIHVLNVADGAEAYRYQFRSGGETYQFAVQNGMLYSRTDRAILQRSFAFSMTIDGTEHWYFRTSTELPAYPAVRGDVVYIAGSGGLWAHDAATGETLWNIPELGTLNPDIVLIDDVIYVGGAPSNQMIFAVNAADGSVLSSIPVPSNGAQIVGITDGVLIARTGVDLVALANLS